MKLKLKIHYFWEFSNIKQFNLSKESKNKLIYKIYTISHTINNIYKLFIGI